MDKLTIKTENIVLKLNTGSIVVTGGAVQSVQGKTGAVILDAIDVDAEPLGSVANLKAYVDGQDALKANKDYVDEENQLLREQIDLKANAQAVNQALSTKADLDESGKVPASQLPSYVDDVLDGRYVNPSQFNDLNGNPYTPESGKVYVDVDTNKTYRWSGMLYVVIGGGGVALGETSETAYRGDRGKAAFDHSQSQGNPHNSTTSEIPEGNRQYFTPARVRATDLTGLTPTTGTVNAADSFLVGFNKIVGTLAAVGPPTWVSVKTLAGITWHSSVDVANSTIELAKINGMLWLRGWIRSTANIPGNVPIVLWTQASWQVDVSGLGLGSSYYYVAAGITVTSTVSSTTPNTLSCEQQLALINNGTFLKLNASFVGAGIFGIPMFCLGRAL
ncbi:hypothetical protein NDN13_01440 [Acinetobacter sp. C32I]|uniref:hypothetical protein n=1 Tax=Acinetobacter sp. C32I TaxID=2950074 RepID=UPI002036DC42|nr:hypothetical protein [Acinetobacter sp. C32I]USA53884.1 hypothetical protein NDN13_01440 [Acinetobacter sp. C32I]